MCIRDSYEEIWEKIPEQLRRKATGPTEELGARITTPPPTPPPSPGGENRPEPEESTSEAEASDSSEGSGEESAEEDEGRTKTTLQARIKKNGKIELGYAKKMEGTERTENTKTRMSLIKRGPMGLPINTKETKTIKK